MDPNLRISISDARSQLADLCGRAAEDDDQIVIEKNGRPVAALISIEAYEFLVRKIAEAEDRADVLAVLETRADPEQSETLPFDELVAELGLDE